MTDKKTFEEALEDLIDDYATTDRDEILSALRLKADALEIESENDE